MSTAEAIGDFGDRVRSAAAAPPSTRRAHGWHPPATMAATVPASLTVLVTGASAGIGAAVARRFARDGSRVIITGRRRDKLAALHDELAKSAPCHVLCFDVSNRADVEKVCDPVRLLVALFAPVPRLTRPNPSGFPNVSNFRPLRRCHPSSPRSTCS